MKGKRNVGPGKNLSKTALVYEKHGTPIPKAIAPISKVKAMALSVVRRLTDRLLHRVPVDVLDEALTAKLGKPASKSEIVREKAKAYNEGFQDALKKYRKKGYWL